MIARRLPVLNDQQTLALIESGVQAPSADNRHPVQFEPLPHGLRIRVLDSFRSELPHRRWLINFALGAVVENVVIRARDFGVTTDVVLQSEPLVGLELTWRSHSGPRDHLSAAIPERRTNRKLFQGPALPSRDLEQLALETSAFPPVEVHWCDEPMQRKSLVSLLRRAEAERFCRQALHRELFEAIRWDVGWHSSCGEGLPPGALEVEPPLRPVFRSMRVWTVMRILSAVGTHHLLGLRAAAVPARLAPHLGVLTVRSETFESTFDAGRAFQRLWLRATLQGQSIQPLAACPVLIRQVPGAGWVTERTRSILEEGLSALFPDRRLAMVFRMGTATVPTVRAGRLPSQSYLADVNRS